MNSRDALATYFEGADDLPSIGSLVMYTISAAAPHAQIAACAHTHGMEAPAEPSAEHTFRRMASEAETRAKRQHDLSGHRFLIRNAKSESGKWVATVVVESVETEADDVNLEFAPEVQVIQAGDRASVLAPSNANPIAKAIANDIALQFHTRRTEIPSDTVRNGVRRHLLDNIGAVRVRESGGVFFVPATKYDRLGNLVEYVNCLPGTSSIDVIPLIDNQSKRDLVAEALTADVTMRAAKLSAELNSSPSDKRRSAIMAEYMELNNTVSEYKGLLNDTLSTASIAVSNLGDAAGLNFDGIFEDAA